MMPRGLLYILLVVGILIVLILLKSLGKRWLGNVKRFIRALLMILFALLLLSVLINYVGYREYTHQDTIATLRLLKLSNDTYRAQLRYPNGTLTDFKLQGHYWRLDARILKWKSWATFFGMRPKIQLERFVSFTEQNSQISSTNHALSVNPNINLQAIAKEYSGWINWYDSIYGASVYMPMADGALYTILLSSNGLVVKPSNAQARAAIVKQFS